VWEEGFEKIASIVAMLEKEITYFDPQPKNRETMFLVRVFKEKSVVWQMMSRLVDEVISIRSYVSPKIKFYGRQKNNSRFRKQMSVSQ
jgi:hypothetical protein